MAQTISASFSFNLEKDISIGETSQILKEYHSKFEDAFNLKTPLPIFLDTNILLNYYGMSIKDKAALKTFFQEKSNLIHLTEQIEKEFQRNRISTIQDYFDELRKIKTDFKSDLLEGIKNRFNNIFQSKIVEKDFPEILAAVKEIYTELNTKLLNNKDFEQQVYTEIDKTISEQSNMEFLDPILEVYKEFNRLDNFTIEEKDYLQKTYIENLKIYDEAKDSTKWKFSFPGCGERKDNDAVGDYIIFHEIIKFMKNNKTDAIFLTRDVTKSDWLQRDRKPFIHYIEKVYQLTGQTLFIFDATDLLKRISFENIYEIEQKESDFEEDEEDQEEHFFLKRFQNIVTAVGNFITENKNEEDVLTKVNLRSIDNQDIDFIITKKNGTKEGIIVYNCGSSKKGFRKNVQRRINACNKLIYSEIVDSAKLFICLKNEKNENSSAYNLLHTNYQLEICVGYYDVDNSKKFIQKNSMSIIA